jgi:hypothetical protein
LRFYKSPDQNDICWLELLPRDVQNHIASYLVFRDRESDQEFIKRTSRIKEITCDDPYWYRDRKTCEYGDVKIVLNGDWSIVAPASLSIANKKTRKKKILYRFPFSLGDSFVTDTFMVGASPDFSKVILAQEDDKKVDVKIFDVMSEKSKKYSLQKESLLVSEKQEARYFIPNERIYCQALAMSNDCTFMGAILKYSYKTSDWYYLHIATINDAMEDLSPFGSKLIIIDKPNYVAFNKQGTKVIVRHNNVVHKIFALCAEGECEQKSIKTLAAYFKQRGVCKELKSSTSSVSLIG